jgi:hypothetical protein
MDVAPVKNNGSGKVFAWEEYEHIFFPPSRYVYPATSEGYEKLYNMT